MGERNTPRVLVLGAGKVGSAVADMLAEFLQARVTLADRIAQPRRAADPLVRMQSLDAGDAAALAASLAGHDLVINALPYYLAAQVARVAIERGVHYFDLTEDVAATAAMRRMAADAGSIVMPQCGLAPGVIGMLGHHLAAGFDTLHDLRLRVGALTRNVTNSLRYNFTWSIDGVINEYCNPCQAIVHGQPCSVQALEGYETFSLGGEEFEAFNTSGGLGTLSESLLGRVRNLDYKTIRHVGHRDAMALLLHDLRLIERRDLLRQVLENAVPHSREDLVIVFASAQGLRDGRLEQSTRSARLYGATLRGASRTAIELSTASGVVGVVELALAGKLADRGFIGQDSVAFDDFLRTRAGRYYEPLRVTAEAPAPLAA